MKRREIFIELTSLLDVILIILFVLLTQARTRTADALAAAESAMEGTAALEQELTDTQAQAEALLLQTEALQEELDSARQQLLSRDVVLDNSLVLTVSAPARDVIRLETGSAGVQTISYRWEDNNYARNSLLSALRQQIAGADGQAVFLVFQFDRASIYHSEYEMVRDVFQEIKLDARQREIPLSILELDISE